MKKVVETIVIGASIETVYEVVSEPHHVAQWWPDRANFRPVPGDAGSIQFGESSDGEVVEHLTVVEATRPTRFAFRWKHPAATAAAAHNSLLVVFELVADGNRTRLTMTETGYEHLAPDADGRELRKEHVAGWGFFLPRLVTYATTIGRST